MSTLMADREIRAKTMVSNRSSMMFEPSMRHKKRDWALPSKQLISSHQGSQNREASPRNLSSNFHFGGKRGGRGGGRKRSKPDYFTRDAVCFIMPLTTFSLCFYERGRRNRKWSGRDEMRWRKLTNEEGGAPRRWIQVNLPDCKKVALFLQEALQYWLFYSFVICSVGRIFWLHCSESGIWTVYFEAHFLYLLCATFCG